MKKFYFRSAAPVLAPLGAALFLGAALLFGGCAKPRTANNNDTSGSANNAVATNSTSDTSSTRSSEPTPEAAEEQKELVKPAAGTGNVQGKVQYNDKPAANILVTLSEKFSTIFGASGKSYTARTNKDGIFVIKNVTPKEYEGLTARVFDTPMVVFMQSGIMSAKKYSVAANQTLFIDTTNLFKADLKIVNPKASSSNAGNLVFKWQAYPAAAYYKVSLYADNFKNSTNVYDQRVDGTTFSPDKPLNKDAYRVQIAAYNASDRKLAESPDAYKFKVQ